MEEIRITGTPLQNPREFVRREWMITNGIGGFAGSSLVGANTRSYHSLLTAATKPPLGRILLVSKLDEEILLEEKNVSLSTNLHTNLVHPEGYQFLTAFSYSFHPTFYYEVDGSVLVKKIYMVYGENTTIVEYNYLQGADKITMKLTPLLNQRDYHGNTQAKDWPWQVNQRKNQFQFTAHSDAVPIYMTIPAEWQEDRYWYQQMYYPIEDYRGLNPVEDHFVPGYFTVTLSPGERRAVIFSTEAKYNNTNDVSQLYQQERDRVANLFVQARANDSLTQRLVFAADQFLVRRDSTQTSTVIAGYPWFSDWGRDSMIALPGLTLETGREKEGREILETFTRYLQDGLIPNRFPDLGEKPEYNTVDATLWLFIASYQYYLKTEDIPFIKEMLPILTEIIRWHCQGTLWGIQMDEDGLLNHGAPDVQLTWMDAKVDEWVVTPRQGKAVEINALWYNSLRIVSELAKVIEDQALVERMDDLSARIYQSFQKQFWNEKAGYLHDRVTSAGPDSTLRPNQLFALSLPFPLLDRKQGKKVLTQVEEYLLTPYGLRSLSPEDSEYHGQYGGDRYARDGAYHQGTVWSWLIGPYLAALWYVEGANSRTEEKILALLEPLLAHLFSDGALGQISEIFDGDRPYAPRGCYAQAWSIGEVLRIKNLISSEE